MTTYRLPEALGGGEVEAIDTPVVVEGTPVRTASGDVLLVPMALLTKVEPPIPPEPRNFSTVRIGGRSWTRDDDPRYEENWHGHDGARTWASLCSDSRVQTGFPPVVLTPVQPVELPWQRKVGRHTTATVDRTGIDEISLHLSSGGYAVAPDITADEARSIALALWAAAEGDAHAPGGGE